VNAICLSTFTTRSSKKAGLPLSLGVDKKDAAIYILQQSEPVQSSCGVHLFDHLASVLCRKRDAKGTVAFFDRIDRQPATGGHQRLRQIQCATHRRTARSETPKSSRRTDLPPDESEPNLPPCCQIKVETPSTEAS
jgi:hypothetical protein